MYAIRKNSSKRARYNNGITTKMSYKIQNRNAIQLRFAVTSSTFNGNSTVTESL